MGGQIFINYRRNDSAWAAGRLFDILSEHFGSDRIFIDVDNLDAGIDFVEAIKESVGSCDVLIAVIGDRWLTSSDEEGRRRVDNSEDFVRLEIATALKRGIRVIPVLVEGVSMPRSDDLPNDLKSLVRRNALEISHNRFKADSERLTGAVERALEQAKAEQRQREEKERLEAERREREEKECFDALRRESEEKERLEAERRKREEEERFAEQRERDEKKRLEVERHQRKENDRLEAEREKEQLQTEQREQKESLEAQRRREEKEAHLTPSARELSRIGAIDLPLREEKAPPLQTSKGRGILAACAGVVIVAVALVVMLSQWQTKPFVNSLGMRFVPVPGTNVLVSVWETRVKDYQAFCDATGRSWTKPMFFPQNADHPAVNVTWEGAKAFCEWLGEKEGKRYRLPTDHEWSCAVGIGAQENADATPRNKDMQIADVFPWGQQWPPPNGAGNYFGEECDTAAGLAELAAAGFRWNLSFIKGFNDGKVTTAAVGSFHPNGLGIYDLGGNVWEWCEDQYEPNSPSRVARGGSWYDGYRTYVLSSLRNGLDGVARAYVGFRVVVEAGSGR